VRELFDVLSAALGGHLDHPAAHLIVTRRIVRG